MMPVINMLGILKEDLNIPNINMPKHKYDGFKVAS